MVEAVPEIVWFALLLLSFALVYVVRKFVEALFNPIIAVVGHIPGLGSALSRALGAIEQSISNKLGAVESGIDSLMGSSFHRFAELNLWLWREIRGHASLLAQIASFIPGIGNVVAALRALVHHSTNVNAHHGARLKTLERELHGIEREVKRLEHDVSKGIGEDVLPRLKSLDRELRHVETKTIPAIRSDVATNDLSIGHLYDWIRGKASIIGAGTFAGAVAAVLSTLGLDWIACRSRNSVNGKSGCNLWDDIEGLLGIATAAVVVADFEDLIHEAQGLIGGVVAGLDDLWNLK